MKINCNEKALLTDFFNLVKIDSESLQCQKIIKYLNQTLKKKLNISVYEQKTVESSNLIAKIGHGPAPLLLSAHMDTVSPGKKIIPKIMKNKIVSNGNTILAADDKAAIAVFLYTFHLVKTHNIPIIPIELVFTYGEEIGLLGAKKLDYSKIKSKYGLCFDADGDVGYIYTSAPYYFQFDIEILGKAAHSGIEPEKGISAIKVLSDIITKIKIGRLNKTTTVNIGLINGGQALNIVPAFAKASGEIRSVEYEKGLTEFVKIKKMVKMIATKYKVRAKIIGKKIFDGFQFNKNDKFLLQVCDVMEKQNIKPILCHSNGGSDANIFNGKGIKTLNLSVGMKNAHTTKEYITIKNLKLAVSVLLQIISKIKVELIW